MDGNKSVASWFRERLSKITTSAQEQASAAGVSVNFDKSTTLQHSEHSLSAAAVSSSAIKPPTQRADFTTSVDRILKEFAPQEEARIAFVGETAGAQGHLIDGLLEGSLAYKDSEVYRKAVAEYLARPSVQKQSEENSLNLCLDNEFAKKVDWSVETARDAALRHLGAVFFNAKPKDASQAARLFSSTAQKEEAERVFDHGRYVLPADVAVSSTTRTPVLLPPIELCFGEMPELIVHFRQRHQIGDEVSPELIESLKTLLGHRIRFRGLGHDFYLDRVFVREKLREVMTNYGNCVAKCILRFPSEVLRGRILYSLSVDTFSLSSRSSSSSDALSSIDYSLVVVIVNQKGLAPAIGEWLQRSLYLSKMIRAPRQYQLSLLHLPPFQADEFEQTPFLEMSNKEQRQVEALLRRHAPSAFRSVASKIAADVRVAFALPVAFSAVTRIGSAIVKDGTAEQKEMVQRILSTTCVPMVRALVENASLMKASDAICQTLDKLDRLVVAGVGSGMSTRAGAGQEKLMLEQLPSRQSESKDDKSAEKQMSLNMTTRFDLLKRAFSEVSVAVDEGLRSAAAESFRQGWEQWPAFKQRWLTSLDSCIAVLDPQYGGARLGADIRALTSGALIHSAANLWRQCVLGPLPRQLDQVTDTATAMLQHYVAAHARRIVRPLPNATASTVAALQPKELSQGGESRMGPAAPCALLKGGEGGELRDAAMTEGDTSAEVVSVAKDGKDAEKMRLKTLVEFCGNLKKKSHARADAIKSMLVQHGQEVEKEMTEMARRAVMELILQPARNASTVKKCQQIVQDAISEVPALTAKRMHQRLDAVLAASLQHVRALEKEVTRGSKMITLALNGRPEDVLRSHGVSLASSSPSSSSHSNEMQLFTGSTPQLTSTASSQSRSSSSSQLAMRSWAVARGAFATPSEDDLSRLFAMEHVKWPSPQVQQQYGTQLRDAELVSAGAFSPFSALTHQLFGTPLPEHVVRLAVMLHILQHEKAYDLPLRKVHGFGAVEFVQKSMNSRSHESSSLARGGHVTLKAFADRFNTDLVLYTPFTAHPVLIRPSLSPSRVSAKGTGVVCLGLISASRFESLVVADSKQRVPRHMLHQAAADIDPDRVLTRAPMSASSKEERIRRRAKRRRRFSAEQGKSGSLSDSDGESRMAMDGDGDDDSDDDAMEDEVTDAGLRMLAMPCPGDDVNDSSAGGRAQSKRRIPSMGETRRNADVESSTSSQRCVLKDTMDDDMMNQALPPIPLKIHKVKASPVRRSDGGRFAPPSLVDVCIAAICSGIDMLPPLQGSLPQELVQGILTRLVEERLVCDETLRRLLMGAEMLTLDLSNCTQLSYSSCLVLAKHCPQVYRLNLSGCSTLCPDGISRLICAMPGLEYLNLSGCARVDASVLSAVAYSCPKLISLNVTQCSSVEDEGISEVISRCLKLRSLRAAGCPQLTSLGVEGLMLSECGAARALSMKEQKDTSVAGQILELDVSLLRLSDETVASIACRCRQLTVFHFAGGMQQQTAMVASANEDGGGRTSVLGQQQQQYHGNDSNGNNHDGDATGAVDATMPSSSRSPPYPGGHTPLVPHLSDLGIMAIASKCAQLRSLHVTSCDISDEGLRQILRHCPKLNSLHLPGCRRLTSSAFIASDAADVDRCGQQRHPPPPITDLMLARCGNIGDLAVSRVALLFPELQKLDLSCCEGVSDKGVLEVSSHCHRLVCINLSRCSRVSDVGITALANRCRHMEELRLYGVGKAVTDMALMEIAHHCPRLRVLDISSCEAVGDAGVMELARTSPPLRKLWLDSTAVTDRSLVPLVVQCGPSLRLLHLAYCEGVGSAAVQALAVHAPGLQQLDLSYCNAVPWRALVSAVDAPSPGQPPALAKLRVLRLRGYAHIVACGFSHPQLCVLDLSWSRYLEDGAVVHLARGCGALEQLDLAWCGQVSVTAVHALAEHCAQLVHLNLQGCTRLPFLSRGSGMAYFRSGALSSTPAAAAAAVSSLD